MTNSLIRTLRLYTYSDLIFYVLFQKLRFRSKFENMSLPVSDKYLELLKRTPRGTVQFNDVFFEREVDFDAELTVILRNLGQFSNLLFPIGKNPLFGNYGAVLLDDLLAEERKILKRIKQNCSPDVYRPIEERLEKAIITIINCAPRSALTTRNGMNGEDFHLAITDRGLEIYCVPVERLEALETRNRILALYRIPNESLRATDGSLEQFRSSIIATTRYFPETLEVIYQYENAEQLMKAKKQGEHPNAIPTQSKSAQLAFVDKFGNVRISVLDNEEFMQKCNNPSFGDKLQIKIGDSQSVVAYYVQALKDIPTGELGIYQNISDKLTNGSHATYWEIVRKSEDPNNEPYPAAKALEALNPNYMEEEFSVFPY